MRDRGPFHAGEVEVQRRAGVREAAEQVGRIVRSELGPDVARVLREMKVAVAGSIAPGGAVWASLLVGAPGFLRTIDARTLRVDARVRSEDPLADNLTSEAPLGLLAIDLATRRRLRLNGRARLDVERRIVLTVEQVYGNCPKYIHPRQVDGAEPDLEGAAVTRSTSLDARQQRAVAAADTLFIASHHPEGGADVSHRGGPRGFVEVAGPRELVFADYPGNNMFNTLGNLVAAPRAGLLVPDFESGSALQISGRATVEWMGTTAAVRFAIDAVIETPAGIRGRLAGPRR
jgi:uncharacterized protein